MTDDSDPSCGFLSFLRNHATGVVVAGFGIYAATLLLRELYADLQSHWRVQHLRKTRPPAVPQIIMTPVTQAGPTIWEPEVKEAHVAGVRPMTHHQSLEMSTRIHFRPGSKLRQEEGASDHVRRIQRPYRILSLDGGGVKGIFSLRILERLLAKFPHLLRDVDLIAGTSTGGLVALLLAAGYTPTQGLEIYKHEIPIIFHSNIFRRISPFRAKYADLDRYDTFHYYLGDRTLGDLGKHVVITAFRLDGGPQEQQLTTFFPSGAWHPVYMSNIPLCSGMVPPDNHLSVATAAMRTTSAPTYFPAYRSYVDGAVVAQNPSLLALSRAYAHFPDVTPENCVILSIGTGKSLKDLPAASCVNTLDWGLGQWAPTLVDLLMEATMLTTEHTLNLLLKNRYHNVDHTYDEPVLLDDVAVVDELIVQADSLDLTLAEEFIVTTFLFEGRKRMSPY